MRASHHAYGCIFSGEHRTKWKAPANALSHSHNIRRNPCPFMGKQFARAANATLDFIKHQQDAMLIAKLTKTTQTLVWYGPYAAFALNWLNIHSRRVWPYRRFQSFVITKSNLNKTRCFRPKAFQIFFLSTSRECRKRAPVKCALKRDDLNPFGCAIHIMKFACHFNGKLSCFSARVAEKHSVSK